MSDKKNRVVLLGDGFFARGFLHHINYNKFFVTQIYKESFINPQDIMYSLQRGKKYESYNFLHIRDFFTKGPDEKIKMDIKNIDLTSPELNVKINNNEIKYDHLVVGLGSQKTLGEWRDQINNLIGKKWMKIAIVGMGPSGIELGSILSKNNYIDMYDMLPKDKSLTFLSPHYKNLLLEQLNNKQSKITTTFGQPYVASSQVHDTVLFCGGSRPNQLIDQTIKVNQFLEIVDKKEIHIGGDCVNTGYIKTAQVAYQQGAYVAKRLNGDIPIDQPFEYTPNGSLINIGDKKVIIEGHKFVPNGIYPDFISRLYSIFCI
jgi:NADH dehydrogenase FAD-containing subunit